MMVEVLHKNDKLHINIDIKFPRLPCHDISVDVEDMMGTHMQNVHNSIDKMALDMYKRPLGLVSQEKTNNIQEVTEKTKKAIDSKEGCYLKGFVAINRVPGNVHISSHVF